MFETSHTVHLKKKKTREVNVSWNLQIAISSIAGNCWWNFLSHRWEQQRPKTTEITPKVWNYGNLSKIFLCDQDKGKRTGEERWRAYQVVTPSYQFPVLRRTGHFLFTLSISLIGKPVPFTHLKERRCHPGKPGNRKHQFGRKVTQVTERIIQDQKPTVHVHTRTHLGSGH